MDLLGLLLASFACTVALLDAIFFDHVSSFALQHWSKEWSATNTTEYGTYFLRWPCQFVG
uniref:AlNc14C230G9283 protein n=1 Tax=Albugo laibachii Nc14 TaxID=890382 RepID=F0WSE3_9STRA|nr:AlNc14C230G9283 [Albugo laibachii Nc14]|eukprot:CCA24263.1 AlNc14C230G9283 [Albugo laibachii Nc14]